MYITTLNVPYTVQYIMPKISHPKCPDATLLNLPQFIIRN